MTLQKPIGGIEHLLSAKRHFEIEKDMGMRSMSTLSSLDDLIFAADFGGW